MWQNAEYKEKGFLAFSTALLAVLWTFLLHVDGKNDLDVGCNFCPEPFHIKELIPLANVATHLSNAPL